jgi:Fe-Mn family superoxide dismutase
MLTYSCKYKRIKLPYELNDLEPIVSYRTMFYHYEILHKNYEAKLTETLQRTDIEEKFASLEELMINLEDLPAEIKKDVRFFGGGLINHNFFFAHLIKKDHLEKKISKQLLMAINKGFGNLDNLKKRLLESALKVRGSGWTWLVLEKNNELSVTNTANQDGPWSLYQRPLIAIDVWEHAYFLDYGAKRQEYVEKLINNLLNWEYINQVYSKYF